MASSGPSKRRRKGKPKTKESSSKSTLTQDNAFPLVVFGHGAGAPSSSDWMIRGKEMLKKVLNVAEVVTFDYPEYVWGKRKVSTKAQTDTRDPQMQMSQIF
ncbi:hypothetical protein Golob_006220 [Gossypium lobatum]|uniref:KANL3/Tex30 alpha/beta hydrolase-like domain-containing protein n=1 Tax=Gossypium lobatum TaxID=34289 RepID=A0A7J8MW13_9ROSI|nr:hypothetical protein [Gossypium lobatum]